MRLTENASINYALFTGFNWFDAGLNETFGDLCNTLSTARQGHVPESLFYNAAVRVRIRITPALWEGEHDGNVFGNKILEVLNCER